MGPGDLRHTRGSPNRCSLPGLAGFDDSCCAGPEPTCGRPSEPLGYPIRAAVRTPPGPEPAARRRRARRRRAQSVESARPWNRRPIPARPAGSVVWAEAHPASWLARLWRWHTGWCPGWRAYQAHLAKTRAEARGAASVQADRGEDEVRGAAGGSRLSRAVPAASGAELITNVAGRKTTSLDGPWQTIVDPYENGYYDYRREPMANGFFRNEKPKDKSDRVEYDFDACGHPERARRLEHAARDALLLRGHDLVREVLRLRAPGRRAPLRLLRRGQLPGDRLPQRREARRARGRLHALLLRDHRQAAREGQLPGGQGRQRPAPRRGADREHRLVELRRDHALRRAGRGPGDLRRRLRRAAAQGLAERGLGLGPALGQPARADGHGRDPRGEGREDRPHRRAGLRRAALSGEARPLVARQPQALRRRRDRRDRPRPRADRLPLDRGQGRRDPAQRPADLPARHLRPRGGAVPHRAGVLRRGGAHPARLGQGAGRQLRAPRALPAQRGHDAGGRPPGRAGLVGGAGLLDDPLGERGHLRERPQPAQREHHP